MSEVLGNRLSAVSRVAGGLVLLLALYVLASYPLGDVHAITLRPGLQGMSPLTALALGLLALPLALADTRIRLGRAAPWIAVGLAVAVMISHVVADADLLSPIFTAAIAPAGLAGGRMSIATAVSVTALAGALLLKARHRHADSLAALAMLVSGVALLGYLYGVEDLYAVRVFQSMALHTAFAIFTLSIALVLARDDRVGGWHRVLASPGGGGTATRRQLIFLGMPPVAGWLLVECQRGGLIGPAAALAFLVAVTVMPLALLVLRDGHILEALEVERTRRLALESRHRNELEQRLMAQAVEIERRHDEQGRLEAGLHQAQRLEAVGQLTAGIAHDFNNLLMSIGGNLQLVSRRLEETHPAFKQIGAARQAVEKGARLASQLLAFSRTQKLDMQPHPVDPMLERAVELIASALGPGIELVTALAAPGVHVQTDTTQFELAILNLALNARDAMADGGRMTLASRLEPSEGGEEVVVTLTDTGVGMSAAVADRAVEPFFTTKERGKGTGLGLAQVYGVVRQSGGKLDLRSTPGFGTTVEIRLSRVESPATAVMIPASASVDDPGEPSMPRARPSVLVIDDDDRVRRVMVDFLREEGYDVVEAANGIDGLKHLEQGTPAAAIIDYLMPGLSGAEVARRAQARTPGLPILFVSGFFDTAELEGIPASSILRKPFDLDRFELAVKQLVSQ